LKRWSRIRGKGPSPSLHKGHWIERLFGLTNCTEKDTIRKKQFGISFSLFDFVLSMKETG
jgi:hypothetical protein